MAPSDSSPSRLRSSHAPSGTYRGSSTSSRHARWQRAFEAVLAETDTKRLFKLVEDAEAAVLTRRSELEGSLNHHAERQAIERAVAQLQRVKRERLNFR